MEALEKIQVQGWQNIRDCLDAVRGYDAQGFHSAILDLYPQAELVGFSQAKLEFTFKYLVQFLFEQGRNGEETNVEKAYADAVDAAEAMRQRQRKGDLKGISSREYLDLEVVEFSGFSKYDPSEMPHSALQEIPDNPTQPATVVNGSKAQTNNKSPNTNSTTPKKRGPKGDRGAAARVVYDREKPNLQAGKIKARDLALKMAEETGLAVNSCQVYISKFRKEDKQA